MLSADDLMPPSGGRGRGRGRGRGGGIPVLPAGMWAEAVGSFTDMDAKFSDVVEDKTYETNKYTQPRITKEVPATIISPPTSSLPSSSTSSSSAPLREWVCTLCESKNWSWRQLCSRCNTPKPTDDCTQDETTVSSTNVESTKDPSESVKGHEGHSLNGRETKEAAALARLQSKFGFISGVIDTAVDPSLLSTTKVIPTSLEDARKAAQNTYIAPLAESLNSSTGLNAAQRAREEAAKRGGGRSANPRGGNTGRGPGEQYRGRSRDRHDSYNTNRGGGRDYRGDSRRRDDYRRRSRSRSPPSRRY